MDHYGRPRTSHRAVSPFFRVEKAEGDKRHLFDLGVLGNDHLFESFRAVETERVGRFDASDWRIDSEITPFVQGRQGQRFNRTVAGDLNGERNGVAQDRKSVV